LPGDHWILVDCHLTKHDGMFDRFFRFLEQRKIKRLEYIVLTHPDIDHFLGMTDVLRYFTSDGRSVGAWCDSGPNSQQVRDLQDSLSRGRYHELQKLLDELDEKKQIVFHPVDRNGCEIGPQGFEGQVDLVPIAPDPSELRSRFRRGVRRLPANFATTLAANPLSVVLVLCINDNGRYFHLLLGADPEADGLEAALGVWVKRATAKRRPQTLNAVKVPHHGSPGSHCHALCQIIGISQEVKVAVVSAGMRPLLPERSVLADYLSCNWTLLITTTRGVRRQRTHFSSLIAKKPSSFATGQYDIQLSWSSAEGLRWRPPESQVVQADLASYHLAE
jgi:hypothetical protein